jgi:hypothetical protein
MEPLPPPEGTAQPDRPPWWFGFAFSFGLFSLSFVVNVHQREQQREQMRRQADDLAEIRARLEERDTREGRPPPERR